MPKLNSPKRRFLLRIRVFGRETLNGIALGAEAARQKVRSYKRIPADSTRSIHILLMSRDVYLRPTIRCANSIWFHAPQSKICIWADSERRALLEVSLKQFHRKDRVIIKDVPLPDKEWQRNKLEIIVAEMEKDDLFTDADIIWNASPPKSEKPIFFVDEYELGRRTVTRWLLKKLDLDLAIDWRMLNVSVVSLGVKSKNREFIRRSVELYERIRGCKPDFDLGLDDLPSIRRMSEQLALSVAVKESSEYDLLKESDSYMDGGIAESYYLGAIHGYD